MRCFWTLVSVSCALFFTGCASAPFVNTSEKVPGAVQGPALRGRVHGGQQPVSGASVYLFAAGTGGYGNGSQSLLTTGDGKDSSNNYYVMTASDGTFTFPSGYTCPSATSQVYVYSIGGDSGGGPNPAIGLMAAVGPCSSLTSSTFIPVNEVSTIVTAYALAGFATSPTHISSSGSALAATGMTNAFAAVSNLESMSALPLATTPAGNGTVPQVEINTLADILAACINSTGSGSTGCTTLFSNALNGTTPPTDTAMAAINMAHYPGTNVGPLLGLATSSAPFQPTLSSASTDLTISISFTGGGMLTPGQPAVDAEGNIWVGNVTTLTEMSPTGVPISTSSGFSGSISSPSSIAIDSSGNVWATNYDTSTLSVFDSSGTPITGSPFSGGGLNKPWGIAIDGSGNAWVGNNNADTVSKFGPNGSPVSTSSGYPFTGLSQPFAVAVDTSGSVWVGSYNNYIAEFSSGGTAEAGSTAYSNDGIGIAYGIAIDASGNVWEPSYLGGDLVEFEPGTGFLSGMFGDSGGGARGINGLAIDGAGNVWVSNLIIVAPGEISEFSSSGTAITSTNGYVNSTLTKANGIVVDGSGNVWVPSSATNSLIEFVGAGTPVVTPIVANLLTPYGMYAVNMP